MHHNNPRPLLGRHVHARNRADALWIILAYLIGMVVGGLIMWGRCGR